MSMSFTLPLVFGHRGARAVQLENTIKAFTYACQSNIEGIELDVMLSKDGVAMVFHDETLDRLSEKKGRLDSFTAQELRSFDLQGNEKIPTLAEVLDLLENYDGLLNIEIKPSCPEVARQTTQEVCKIVKEKNFDTPKKLFFSSFEQDALREAFKLLPNIKRGVLVEDISPDWREFAKEIEAYSINYDEELLTPELINEIKEKGFHLLSYTVNSPERAIELRTQGVEGFFCDNPVVMRDALTNS